MSTPEVVTAAEQRLVTTSMAEFLASHPDLRYMFFGGKGGVGKTVLAGVAAVHLAATGRRVLLASTNPVHSLSGLLDQDVFGRHEPVKGVDNLWALEIDTRDSIQRAKRDIKEKIELVPEVRRDQDQGRRVRGGGHHQPGVRGVGDVREHDRPHVRGRL